MTDARNPSQLLTRFIEAVADAVIPDEAKAEIVINLAKAWGIDDLPLKQELQRHIGPEAADHPYFHWSPRPRFSVGAPVRVVSGAPQALGRRGRVTSIEDPRRYGVRGMARSFFYTIVFDDAPDAWGFREEQLEIFE